MEIVSMNHSHTEILADLEKLCFSTPWSKKSLDDQVENPRAFFVVAVEGDSVLGYGGMHCVSSECYLDNIAVFRHHRRKGVATAIIGALEKHAREINSDFLSLEVRRSNWRANDLYFKCGFEEEGRRKNFYTDPMEDALILTKWLRKGRRDA